MEKRKTYRHGDVIIRESGAVIPEQAKQQKDLVLAEGEMTGHRHKITEGAAELFTYNEKMHLKILSKIAKVDHQEHGLGELPEGNYEIIIQQEWQETGWKKVVD